MPVTFLAVHYWADQLGVFAANTSAIKGKLDAPLRITTAHSPTRKEPQAALTTTLCALGLVLKVPCLLERIAGIEPAARALEGRCSTAELNPLCAPDSGRSLRLHRFAGIAR